MIAGFLNHHNITSWVHYPIFSCRHLRSEAKKNRNFRKAGDSPAGRFETTVQAGFFNLPNNHSIWLPGCKKKSVNNLLTSFLAWMFIALKKQNTPNGKEDYRSKREGLEQSVFPEKKTAKSNSTFRFDNLEFPLLPFTSSRKVSGFSNTSGRPETGGWC